MKNWLTIALLLIVAACNPVVKVSNQNLSDLYNPDKYSFNPFVYFFHTSDSISNCFIRINKNEFLYKKPDISRNFCALIRISIEVFPSYTDNTIIDSSSVLLIDSVQNAADLSLVGSIAVHVPNNFKGIARITIKDLNKNNSQQFFYNINKANKYTNQYYRIESINSNNNLSNVFNMNDSVRITPLFQTNGVLLVKYYQNDFDFPNPPFVLENLLPIKLQPDTVFSIYSKEENAYIFPLTEEGIYFIQISDTCSSGLSILSLTHGYPNIITPEQMLPPLRYITTQKEYDRISSNPDLRTAIDDFWLSIGGNPERARNLISMYYNRVIEANKLFTSYTEGWKTDRGMAYIIFGTPNIMYRSDEGEYWVYGEERNFYSITLQFVKMQNPYTENDYQLQRAPMYKDNWYRAVDLWRR